MRHLAKICILSFAIIASAIAGARAQQSAAHSQAAPATSPPPSAAAAPAGPIDLRPKFAPGQTLRYQMELQTTTIESSGGVVEDPQGPSKLVVTWDATVRVDVLPPGPLPPNALPPAGAPAAQASAAPVALRLRMTYEKSTATVQSDGYDPAADSVRDRYERLQGHTVEFALDARGKVIDASGVEDVFDSPQAARDAQSWVEQLSSGLGAPGAGAAPGLTWSSDEAATAIPLPDMTWHTDSTYLRNEPCRQSASAAPGAAGASSAASAAPAANASSSAATADTCAVVLAHILLVAPRSAQKSAGPDAIPKPAGPAFGNMKTAGTWSGSGESLIYVSLRTGWVVSVSQTGDEAMDVTIVNEHYESIRYAGAVHSHVNLLLLPQ